MLHNYANYAKWQLSNMVAIFITHGTELSFLRNSNIYDYMDIKMITDVVEYMENIGNLMYPPYFYGLVAYEHQNESSPNFF